MRSRPDAFSWLCLARAEGLGPRGAAQLLAALGSPAAIRRASAASLAPLLGSGRAQRVARGLKENDAPQVLRALRAAGQRLLTPATGAWPAQRLGALPDPPLALFVQGRRPRGAAPVAAVVGTREASSYGLALARRLACDLVEAGVWVVSGLALGVDGAAHQGALDARPTGAASTLAVLGAGLDVAYPLAHLDLRRRILERGGLLSEHPPGTRPERHHFPMRNRIVAALSDVVVVVEAPERSGALVTARLALELGRDVLAVPGPVGAGRHAGSHRLLREGAGVCEGVADVLAALRLDVKAPASPRRDRGPTQGVAGQILGLLEEGEALSLDALCAQGGTPAREALLALATLEAAGWVRRVAGGWQRLR